ncbi:MAG TPA: ATP-binding cassette domain-containing protein [Syntrophales bacterium]|nr:ATP-binding cassette domain-containing protein [Syntrophales bacterium]
MFLQIDVAKKLKDFELKVSVRPQSPSLTVFIGPSGSGKTSLVRLVAGLDRPGEGRIQFGNETWVDTAAGIFVPPQKRGIGYVFQEYTLFPHLDVCRNVAFAAKDPGKVDRLLERLRIGHLRRRRPDTLSGGERQRCALCQALASGPRVLLLDEPFSALDVMTRRELREEVKCLKDELGIPILYITHDISEALYLADDIIPLVEGRIDRGWLKRTIAPAESGPAARRAVRETKLGLSY